MDEPGRALTSRPSSCPIQLGSIHLRSGVCCFMIRYSFRHYRRSSHRDLVGTLIARHFCNAANAHTAIAHVEMNFLSGFQAKTDSADLSDETGELVWQIPGQN